MAELSVRDLDVRFEGRGRGPVTAVSGANLTVRSGEIVGLVGESGCGKSSLARALAGLLAPARGQVLLDGRPVARIGWHKRSATDCQVQMVFQDPNSSLNPRRRVGAQIADGLGGREASADRVGELLDRVGMPRTAATRYPHQFSGGQRQRLAIARALGPRPAFLLADEPVTALDASAQAQVVGVLQALVRDAGVGIVFITHDLALVNEIADRIAVMYLGQIVELGPAADLLSRPRHPYTRVLIDAIPSLAQPARLPAAPEGEVPDPTNAPRGCRFVTRCAYAVDACHTPQALTEVAAAHSVACHRADELAALLAQPTPAEAADEEEEVQ